MIPQRRFRLLPLLLSLATLLFIGGGIALVHYRSTTSQAITVQGQPISPAQFVQGEEVYAAHCTACHGPDGQGQPNWKIPGEDGLYPAPPHNSAGHTWHHADDLLLEIIAEGGGAVTPSSGMPGYRDLLTPAEMIAALAYIKTFWGPEELDFQNQVTQNASN